MHLGSRWFALALLSISCTAAYAASPTIETSGWPGVFHVGFSTLRTQQVVVGYPFQYTIGASGSPTSYDVTGLPAGLSVDRTSGVISGSPQVAGNFPLTLTARNADGAGTANVTLQVNPAPTAAPVLMTPPDLETSYSGYLGNSVGNYIRTILLTATNFPRTYGATGAPSGVQIDPNGVIDYDVNRLGPGLYNVTVSATNPVGTGTASFRWAVRPRVFSILPDRTMGYTIGETITLRATFDAPVVVTGTPSVPLTARTSVKYVGGSGTTTLFFSHSTTADDFAPGDILVPQRIVLGGGTINHSSGVSAVLEAASERLAQPVYIRRGILPAPPIVSDTSVTGQVGTAITPVQVAATNAPSSYSAPGLAGYGLSISATGAISGTPTAVANGITVLVTATNAGGTSASANIVVNISPAALPTTAQPPASTTPPPTSVPPPVTTAPPTTSTPPPVVTTPPPSSATKAAQTITFLSPVTGVVVGQPITLGATSSAGLPITYTVVSGDATISGNIITPRSTAVLIVRASSAGDDTYAAASADTNFGAPQRAGQSLALPPIAAQAANAPPLTLSATSSAGLPINYTLLSGPAVLNGNVLTLNGASGRVVVRALQPGNEAVAASEATIAFDVRAAGQQVYFGTIGSDPFAVSIAQDDSRGTFVTKLAGTGETIVAPFQLAGDGSFSATVTSNTGALRSVSGRVLNGVLSGAIAGLNASFSANVQPATGATAALAGLYRSVVPGSASGNGTLIVGPSQQVYALVATPGGSAAGMGAVTAAGAVSFNASGTTVDASIAGNGTVGGTLTVGTTTATLAGLSDAVERTDQLVNLSSRLRVAAGDSSRAVVAGFVIAGTHAKKILVRAIGPGLATFGVSRALENPKLQLFDRDGRLVAENDDWISTEVNATADGVGAFRVNPGSKDAALVVTLAPGAYTAAVTGSDGEGVVLIEVYDASSGAPPGTQQLINISTRGFVDTGEGALIAGFVVSGNAPKKVLVRGIGPALSAFGVNGAVSDPVLTLHASGSTAVIARNDNWENAQPVNARQMAATGSMIATAAQTTGAFPLSAGSKDAAIVVTLLPGNYTAVVSGAANATGAGLIEVYEIAER